MWKHWAVFLKTLLESLEYIRSIGIVLLLMSIFLSEEKNFVCCLKLVQKEDRCFNLRKIKRSIKFEATVIVLIFMYEDFAEG